VYTNLRWIPEPVVPLLLTGSAGSTVTVMGGWQFASGYPLGCPIKEDSVRFTTFPPGIPLFSRPDAA